MSRYTIMSPDIDDIPRLAKIQQAAFNDGGLTVASMQRLTAGDQMTWLTQLLENSTPIPGFREEYKIARDKATGEITGWAKWWIPKADGDTGSPKVKMATINGQVAKEVPLPSDVDHSIFNEFFKELIATAEEVMGDRKHWILVILAVDPAWQRQGVGKALVLDGIQRAENEDLPIQLAASPKGVPLYASLGFETKIHRELTAAKISETFMVKESSTKPQNNPNTEPLR